MNPITDWTFYAVAVPAVLLLGISFTLPDWLGTLLILSSVVLIALDSRRRVKTA